MIGLDVLQGHIDGLSAAKVLELLEGVEALPLKPTQSSTIENHIEAKRLQARMNADEHAISEARRWLHNLAIGAEGQRELSEIIGRTDAWKLKRQ